MSKAGSVWFSAAVCLLTASCAPSVSQYRHYYDALNSPSGTVSKTGPVEAIERARGNYPDRDRVLYGMDLGMANNVVGNYRESAKIFRDTDRIIQDLYTKSVTNILLAYQTNDLVMPYRGLPFERVMVNLVDSLNYAGTGDWNGALVETRKIREKLIEYNRRYPDAAVPPGNYAAYSGPAQRLLARRNIPYNPSQLNHYTDDAFARFLSGVYEEAQVHAGGVDYQSAFLSYKKALEAYEKNRALYGTPVPSFLARPLLRTADAAGRVNHLARYKKEFPGVAWTPSGSFETMGHLVFVGYNGRMFHLVSERMAFPFPIMGQVVMVSLAFPKPVDGGTTVLGHDIQALDASNRPVLDVRSELGEDLLAIGMTNFQDHMKRIVLREAIRAIIKTTEQVVAQQQAGKSGGALGQLIAAVVGGVATVVSDIADTRSWRTLPATFDYAQLDLPPGTYAIRLKTDGGAGRATESRVTLLSGEYLFVRTVDVN
jgi:hypothetical protein